MTHQASDTGISYSSYNPANSDHINLRNHSRDRNNSNSIFHSVTLQETPYFNCRINPDSLVNHKEDDPSCLCDLQSQIKLHKKIQGFLNESCIMITEINALDLPQGYSAFLSFVQKEEHDDFAPADVLEVYRAFEASRNPVIRQDIITEISLVCQPVLSADISTITILK